MLKEFEFFIFLIEQYALYKNTTSDKILKEWDELSITDTIFEMYERYHIECLENAFEDIERLASSKK